MEYVMPPVGGTAASIAITLLLRAELLQLQQ
jgi:hypothetical protein